MRKGFWRVLGFIPIMVAFMSGILSIIREYLLFAAPTKVQEAPLFWGSMRIAFVLSAITAWKLEHKRANTAEEALEAPSIGSKEWDDLARNLNQICQFMSVSCTWNDSTPKTWTITGGDHTETCKAWLGQAGAMLIRSPQVKLDIPQMIKDEPNDLIRWFQYLDHRGLAKRYWGDVMYDNTPRSFDSGTIDEIGRVSALVATEFAAKEFAPR